MKWCSRLLRETAAISLVTSCLVFCLLENSHGQTLKYIETDKPDLLNPIDGSKNVIGVRLLELVFRGLITQDRNGEWMADLAAEMPTFQIGKNEIIVRLREGVNWPDGVPLTAHDVAFSFDIYMDPRNSYGNRNILEIFSDVQVIDEQTVRFGLNQSDARAIARIGYQVMPKHLLSSTFLSPRLGFNRRPMGAGPFSMIGIDEDKNNLMVFERNAHFHGKRPAIERVELSINADENMHRSLLLGDFVSLDPAIRPQDIPQINADAATSIRPYDSKTWFGFAFNCTNEFLRFKEVRQALTYLFDRDDALKATFLNQGDLVSGPYTISSFCYNPEIEPYPYKPERGKELLKQAGFVDTDGDKILDYNGRPMRFRMVLSKQMSQENKDVCANMAQQLGAHGQVQIDMDWQEENVWEKRVFYDRDFDITFVSWKFDEGSNIYPLFSRNERLPGRYNIVQFSHDRVENYLMGFRQNTDDSKRTEIGQRLHQILHEEAPYMFLWTLDYNAAYRTSEISSINIDPFYFFRTIETWEMF